MSRLHSCSALLFSVCALAVPLRAQNADSPLADPSPWGVAPGAEWAGDYKKFDPMLAQAGVTWIRYFPEWQSIQPKKGEWQWSYADSFLSTANENGIKIAGGLWYLTAWNSADGGTRKFPMKEMQPWRDYVEAAVGRYKGRIDHWEIWNEFPSFSANGSPKYYAELVKEAHIVAKKANPDAMIGLGVGNFDIGYLDATIKAGAAGHFDYVCVHPYENIEAAMEGGEMGFLSLAASLRKMLADNKQDPQMPLWITEIGTQAPVQADPRRDLHQADSVAKIYVLTLAQGFSKVFWFEARGPEYGHGTDHGLIRKDWTPRPALATYQAMTETLGRSPQYVGWVNVDGGFGFVFKNGDKPVLATWEPEGAQISTKFQKEVKILSTTGERATLAAGAPLELDRTSRFITEIPDSLVAAAQANAGKPFPWGKDFAKATEVAVKVGAKNLEDGIKMINLETTTVVQGLDWTARRSKKLKGGEGAYMYFRVDPTFAPFGTKDLEITVVARRDKPTKPASFNLTYECTTGYRPTKERFSLPAGEQWTEFTWKVNDANFVGAWGWNIRTDASGSADEFQLREIRVKRVSR